MSRHGRLTRERIAETIEALLATPAIVIEDWDAVERALHLCRTRRLDFADALLGVLNPKAGCTAT